MRTLAAIGRLIRRTPPPPADILEAYAHEVVPVLDRAEWLYQYWLEQSTLFSDSEKLGNVAAVHRWETATMGRSLERVIPPAVLAGAHESVLDALDMASRAAQLLSSGSRFHNANAVCEGQALLATSRERRLSAHRAMRRYLSAVLDPADDDSAAGAQPAPSPEAMLSRPPGLTGLTEVAAFVAQTAAQSPGQDTAAPDAAGPASLEAPADLAGAGGQLPTDLHPPDAYPHDLDAADEHLEDDHTADDDPEDALPWLTRLAAQTGEPPAPLRASPDTPAPPDTPASPLPADPPATDDAPARSGWGSLFGRPDDRADR